VTRGRDTRLTRLASPAARADSAELLDRCARRARLRVCAIVTDRLMRSGIDSATARALRRGEATREQGTLADGLSTRSPRDAATEPFDNDVLAGKFAAKIGDMARRYQDGSEPDVGEVSLAELYAWCLARPPPAPALARLDPASENR
jgi:hypothetical protein